MKPYPSQIYLRYDQIKMHPKDEKMTVLYHHRGFLLLGNAI